MSRILKLKTIDEIRTMSDPYRMKILMVFMKFENKGLTVKDIAVDMGEPHGKVYYHVKKMFNINALEIAKTEKINGITAKYYKTTFDEIVIDSDEDSPKTDLMVKDSLTTYFEERFEEDKNTFIQSIKDIVVGDEADELNKARNAMAYVGNTINVTEESYGVFIKELETLMEKYSEPVENSFKKTLVYTIHPKVK